ncbi:hypothetical protein BDZ45DRAFT_584224, partial [Acephala macrosclerotiorum]
FYKVDIILIFRIRKTGRYITYKYVDVESWPLSMDQIISIDFSKVAKTAH